MRANLIGYTLALAVLLYAGTFLLSLALDRSAVLIAAYLIAGLVLALLICALEKAVSIQDRLDRTEARAASAEEALTAVQAKLDVIQDRLDALQTQPDPRGGE